MLQNLSFDAELIVSFNNIPFLVVAEENYVVVNFKEFQDLDRMLKLVETLTPKKPKTGKSESSNPLKKLNDINKQVRDLGIFLEIRVGSKVYIVLGGNSANLKAAAILGKIGSFFNR